MADISNSDDIIDSRDVIARIEELQEERDALEAAAQEAAEGDDPDTVAVGEAEGAIEDWDKENGDELKALLTLVEEAEGYSGNWKHGATLIRHSYFQDYCEELVKDIGDLPKELPSYIANNIDWAGVAHALSVDYTSVEYDGVEYWVR